MTLAGLDPVLLAFLVGAVGGPLGGLAAGVAGLTVLRQASGAIRGALLAFAGGFILSAAFLELLRRATEQAQGWSIIIVLAGLAAGAALRALIARLAGGEMHGTSYEHAGANGGQPPGTGVGEGAYRRGQARRIAASLAVVNVVEGLAVGVGFAVGTGVGILLGAIMIFENFTEGLSVSTELTQGEQHDARQMLLLTTAPTVTLGLGAALGAFLGGLSPQLLAGLLGAGAGIMLYVVIDDVVYDAHKLGHGAITSAPFIAGAMVGTALTQLA